MAYNSSTLQKLLKEYHENLCILDFQKLSNTSCRACIEPDLEYIKSIDNSICTLLYENIRYVQYIIYSLYNSEYLQKFKYNVNSITPDSCYFLKAYDMLINDIINNNVTHNVMNKDSYNNYIDKLKEVNSNIRVLIDKIKNNFDNTNSTNISLETLNLFNIYEQNLNIQSSQKEIDNFLRDVQKNDKSFLFFSVNKETKKLEYTVTSKDGYVNIINNNKIRNTYIKNKDILSTIEFTPITIDGQYNTKFELLKMPNEFLEIYNNPLFTSFLLTTLHISNFQNRNIKYLDLTKYNVYAFELNHYHNKIITYGSNNSIHNGFYNYKNIGIFNTLNFNSIKPFITSNSKSFLICRSYIIYLQLYGNKVITDYDMFLLFYDEINKLIDYIGWIDKQHTFKYDSQLYLIMNVINNAFIKLSNHYLHKNDVIKIIEHFKLFNAKFVNTLH